MTIYINKQNPKNEEVPYPCGCVAELKIQFMDKNKTTTIITEEGSALAKVEVELSDFVFCATHKKATQDKAMSFVRSNVR